MRKVRRMRLPAIDALRRQFAENHERERKAAEWDEMEELRKNHEESYCPMCDIGNFHRCETAVKLDRYDERLQQEYQEQYQKEVASRQPLVHSLNREERKALKKKQKKDFKQGLIGQDSVAKNLIPIPRGYEHVTYKELLDARVADCAECQGTGEVQNGRGSDKQICSCAYMAYKNRLDVLRLANGVLVRINYDKVTQLGDRELMRLVEREPANADRFAHEAVLAHEAVRPNNPYTISTDDVTTNFKS